MNISFPQFLIDQVPGENGPGNTSLSEEVGF
jgi:hypothetical protein